MVNYLLIGNGFDIAHELKTSYNDFLYLMKNWNNFMEEYERILDGDVSLDNSFFVKKYVTTVTMLNNISLARLGEIIESNLWVKYYCNCGAEMDGWVDFEKEIIPVIDMFNRLLRDGSINAFEKENGFEKFLENAGNGGYKLAAKYRIGLFRPKKKTLLKELRNELDEFIEALELYLHEFVFKRDDLKVLKQIKNISADFIINLNYTLTENIYGFPKEKVHHIHGAIRERWGERLNNMVLGIDEPSCPSLDFVYFTKYFQRLQKRTGSAYKTYIERSIITAAGRGSREEYTLHIYGHSLDRTDEDVLTYLIGSVESGHFVLKAKHVVIYYYDQDDFEKKIINLIDLYGRKAVEEALEKKWFEFRETLNETIEICPSDS